MVAYFFTSVIPLHYPLYPLLKNPIPLSTPSQSRSLRSPEAAKRSVPLRSTSLAAINPAPQELDQPFGLTSKHTRQKKKGLHKKCNFSVSCRPLQTLPTKPLEISRAKVSLTIFQNNQGGNRSEFRIPQPGDTDNLGDKKKGQEAFPEAKAKAPPQGSRGLGKGQGGNKRAKFTRPSVAKGPKRGTFFGIMSIKEILEELPRLTQEEKKQLWNALNHEATL